MSSRRNQQTRAVGSPLSFSVDPLPCRKALVKAKIE